MILITRNRYNKYIANCDTTIVTGIYLANENTLGTPCNDKKFIITVEEVPDPESETGVICTINQHAAPIIGKFFYTRKLIDHKKWTPWLYHG